MREKVLSVALPLFWANIEDPTYWLRRRREWQDRSDRRCANACENK